MSSPSNKPHVLIIGAGLGGLSLAQALRKKGITCQVFERDSSDHARSQGWALSLHPWLLSDFRDSMKDDMPSLEAVGTTYNIGLQSEGAMYDLNLNERARFGHTPETKFIRAYRAKLRQWLMTDIEINWDKKFARYEEDHEGVTALFEDGSFVRGDILVGADGIGSKVRNQLLPEAKPNRLPLGIVVGELTATKEQYRRWMTHATSFYIGFDATRRVFIGLKSVAEDQESAVYYWMVGWHDEAAVDPSYWTSTASKEDLHSYIMNHLDGLGDGFMEPIRATSVDGIFHPPLQMRDMTPPVLPLGRVTLLGDAVHPMVPFRGEGGNMAMKDGIILAKTLDSNEEENFQKALKLYESEMSERTTKSVLASRAAALA